jgi:hypothetical protein
MTPYETVTNLLNTRPDLVGKSRIQATTLLLEQTPLEVTNNNIVFPNLDSIPIPHDLWKWVTNHPYKEIEDNQPTPISNPTSLEDIQLEQTYLQTFHTHYHSLAGLHLEPNCTFWKLFEFTNLQNWSADLLPTLSFWATHPTCASAEALALLSHFSRISPQNLATTLRENKTLLSRLKNGEALPPIETLRALGWDISSHISEVKKSADIALAHFHLNQKFDNFEKEREENSNRVLSSLWKNPEIIAQLPLDENLQKWALQTAKSHNHVQNLLQKIGSS